MVHINDQTVNEEPPAPFGGFGCSSNGGHFGGVANLELWTEWQWLTSREKASRSRSDAELDVGRTGR